MPDTGQDGEMIMEYMVGRTSVYDDNIIPCEGCIQKEYTRIDERTTPDPTTNKYLADWYDYGSNHRVENGHIKRDFKDTAWFIDIADIPALNSFVEKYGDVVIGKSYQNDTIMRIEIYDDYRE